MNNVSVQKIKCNFVFNLNIIDVLTDYLKVSQNHQNSDFTKADFSLAVCLQSGNFKILLKINIKEDQQSFYSF